jgi:putative transposase
MVYDSMYIDQLCRPMSQEFRHNHTSVTLINYHFVWIPRRRRKVLKGAIAERLKELIYQASQEIECKVVALEIMDDHVHLFLNCPPTLAPSDIMFKIKGRSARELRKEFPDPLMKMPSMWTRSYFCSTAGNVSSASIEKYIANQKSR